MNNFKNKIEPVFSFLRKYQKWLLLVLLIALASIAFLDYYFSGYERRTFIFYNYEDGSVVLEERMLKRADSKENDLVMYAEETLMGPINTDSLPLFPKNTRLESLMYRDNIVYLNLSEDAAIAPSEGGDVYKNLKTFDSGIRRNFPYVSDIRFFIAGNAVSTDTDPK